MTQPGSQVLANDFAALWRDVRDDALGAMERVGSSGWWVLGEEVREFERELAAWWGIPFAVGVASGLDALEIALRCAGVAEGSRVLTTPLTAFATTLSILRIGAQPVWCDVDSSGGLDLDRADEVLRGDPEIVAMIPVHLYGHPLDPVALERLATDHDIILIEDCAQSIGAVRDNRPTGSVGFAACTSFYPTKNLGAMGDGGALLTRDEAVAQKARQLRDYGQVRRYEHGLQGLNSRLDEVQAAVLRSAMLPRLPGWLRHRAEVAARYTDVLAGTRLRPVTANAGSSSHHLFPIEVGEGDRRDVEAALADAGIAVGRHYPILCPDQAAAAERGRTQGDLVVARRLAEHQLSLPIHPYLREREVDDVVRTLERLV